MKQQFLEDQLTESLQFGFVHKINYQNNAYAPKIVINNPDLNQYVLSDIQEELDKSNYFQFSVAFVTQAGIAMIKTQLYEFIKRGGKGRILVSPYLGFNDPLALKELLKLKNIEVRFADPDLNLHSKIYLFDQGHEQVIIAGSSNLTGSALKVNYEWNIKLASTDNGDFINQTQDEYNRVWKISEPLTLDLIKSYEKNRTKTFYLNSEKLLREKETSYDVIKPNKMQEEALKGIENIRQSGANRALIISATGTGKTYLSAFDVRAYNPEKFLFVVHREQILKQAQADYQRVIGFSEEESCIYRSGMDLSDKKYIFTTIQSISRQENMTSINADYFDYILIDEVHKAGANSYNRLMNYFTPDFYLGMTATPERTDDRNIYEIFDYNIAYEIRLQSALEEDMLCPFIYFGVSDIELDGEMITEKSDFSRLVSSNRVDHIIEKTSFYGYSGDKVRGLIFCSSVREAEELSIELNQRGYRTVALSGSSSQEERQLAVNQLENGNLDYILTRDIFNEGIDIPSINQVIMLRNTESSIIFIQQLGRGLRKHDSKDYVTIIDFIGNYTNNYLIPIALYGDQSMNKDNYRRDMSQRNQLSGLTTINFEEVPKEQIFKSINKTNLSNLKNLREHYQLVKDRVGRTPLMMDFVEQESLDPLIFFENDAFKQYGDVIKKFEKIDSLGDDPAYSDMVLSFITNELSNGKRPHEILILKELINNKDFLTYEDIQTLLANNNIVNEINFIDSAINVLTLNFFTKANKKKYGNQLIIKVDNKYKLCQNFIDALNNDIFKDLLKDALSLGEYNSFKYPNGYTKNSLTFGKKYTRKDACRLLLWENDESSTVYGYRIKHGTCPIFVTYHKKDDISETTKYNDAFINQNLLHWYSKSRKTLQSDEIKKIRNATNFNIDLHLFVQKDDHANKDFYYLGPVHYQDYSGKETIMPDGDEWVPVVTMNLELEESVPFNLYHYLVSE